MVDSTPPRLVAWRMIRTDRQTASARSAPPSHVEGHDGAEAGHEAARGGVGRVVGAAGVAHDLHPGVLGEVLGELGGRRACALKPQRERAHAADGEVGLECAGRGSGKLAPLAQSVRALVGRGDDGAEQQVGVAAEVLRGRVHDQVGAELKRPLDQRRRERAVDHHQRVRLAARGADGGQVGDRQQRVRRRLQPQQVGVGGELEPARRVLDADADHAPPALRGAGGGQTRDPW